MNPDNTNEPPLQNGGSEAQSVRCSAVLAALVAQWQKAVTDLKRLEQTRDGIERAITKATGRVEMSQEMIDAANAANIGDQPPAGAN